MEISSGIFIHLLDLTGPVQRSNRPSYRETVGSCSQSSKIVPNCSSVRALHRNRRAAGSIPARRLIVTFFVIAPGYRSNKCIKIPVKIPIKSLQQQ